MRHACCALFAFVGLVTAAAPLAAQAAEPASRPAAAIRQFQFSRASVEELRGRRAALAALMKNGAAVVVSADAPTLESGSRYKPGHNIYWLTGVESDFCALLLVAKDGKVASETLFLPTADKLYELWNGRRVVAGDDAKALTGVQNIVAVPTGGADGAIEPLARRLTELAASPPGPIWLEENTTRGGRAPRKAEGLSMARTSREDGIRAYLTGLNANLKFSSLAGLASQLRGVKSPHEVALMREAGRISADGYKRAFGAARPGMWEFEFDGIMQHAFLEAGCTGLPYYPIIASGPNACTYHYTENRRQFKDGEIVLCDVAAEYGYYACDITRAFPVGGHFTPRQRLVYEAVLAGQSAAAAALKPGADLGSMDQLARKAMAAAGLKPAEMHQHGLGHHVGLDVHDVGGGTMEPGMIVTIEPGAYIKAEGLGIRIEDIYLVTETGCECLSAGVPKTIAEIEALVGTDR